MIALLLMLVTVDTLNMSVDEAVLMALRNSPTSADARLDSVEGRANHIRSWSGVMPGLSASGGVGWSTTGGDMDPTHSWRASFSASQVLFDASTFGAILQAGLGQKVYDLQAANKLYGLVWNVKTGYFGLQKIYGLRDIAAAAVKRSEDNLNLAEQKLKFGQATGLEVMRAQTYLSQARLDLMSADKNLAAASEGFKVLLGTTEPVIVKPSAVDTSALPVAFASFNEFYQEVEKRNPNLQLADKSLEVAEFGRKLAWGRMLPGLSASFSHSYGGKDFPTFGNWADNDATSYGISLSLPIFNVKEIVFGIRSANIDLDRAKISLRSSQIALRQTAVNAFMNYEQARRQSDYAYENLKLNQELYRLSQEQYRLGQITLLDLFNTEITLNQARVSYLSAISDVRTQQAQLDYLLGSAGSGQ